MCDMWYNCHMPVWTKEANEAVFKGRALDPKTWAHLSGWLAWHDGPEQFKGPPDRVYIKDGRLCLVFSMIASHSGTVLSAFLDGGQGQALNVTVAKGATMTITQEIAVNDIP